MTFDAGRRAGVLERIAAHVRAGYVFADVGEYVATRLEQERDMLVWGNGHGVEWARSVSALLQRESGDPHMRVVWSREERPVTAEVHDELVEADPLSAYEARNFGVRRVEVLPRGIGVLRLEMFAPRAWAEEVVGAAMSVLARVRGFVIDVRGNGGGASDMVAFVASYFFGEAVSLCSLWDRGEPEVLENWTEPTAETRLRAVPLAVLVDERTASAAESLAYDLRRLGRATIVGAPTLGAAHAIRSHRVDPHVRLVLPYARAVDPEGRNWHRMGVPIDVVCPGRDALAEAERYLEGGGDAGGRGG